MEYLTLATKLNELSEDELKLVTDGIINKQCLDMPNKACSVCKNRMCEHSPVYIHK